MILLLATIHAMVDPRLVASIGLGLDIVGIVLLFCFGGIGSNWIHAPTTVQMVYEVNPGDAEEAGEARDKNVRRATVGAAVGLVLAVA